MSSVPSLPAWLLPVPALWSASKRRRALIAGGGLVAAAAATLALTGTLHLPAASASASAAAPSADLAAARAHAQAVARAEARSGLARTAGRPVASRGADVTRAADLFAARSWYVPPPPPPPAAPAPPPAPTAPPFPYTYVGSFAPQGESPVFFLARGDRVIDAHVGDHLDGVYEFENADGGQLVFNYLPLGIRQSLPGGVDR